MVETSMWVDERRLLVGVTLLNPAKMEILFGKSG
jgi:hypothetical protein